MIQNKLSSSVVKSIFVTYLLVSGGFLEDRNSFSKYVFRPIDWEKEEKNDKILYVGRPLDFPGDKSVIKTIYFLDGEPAIKIVEGG